MKKSSRKIITAIIILVCIFISIIKSKPVKAATCILPSGETCTDTCANVDGGFCNNTCWSCSGAGPLGPTACGGYFSYSEADSVCPASRPTNTPTPRPPTPTPTPTPTPLPPCSTKLETEYECNDDGTARVTWRWKPLPRYNPAEVYLLQVSYGYSFNRDSIEMEREVGSTETFTEPSVEIPNRMRFSRVRVLESNEPCETGGDWEWSNTTSTRKNCHKPSQSETPPHSVNILDDFFCNSSGEAVDDPESGEIFTAIGCVPADELQEFTEFTVRWSIGIAGGITLLLIIYSGYLYTTSKGNPQKIQAAKELITAAVGGLLFLILSATLLRLVSSNILDIPGL